LPIPMPATMAPGWTTASLTPGKGPRLGAIRFDDWLKRTASGNKAA
jgi:hypothetical protein